MLLFSKGEQSFIIVYMSNNSSSFTDFPLIKLPPETDLFLKEDPLGSPWAPYRV